MPQFSQASLKELETLHIDLQKILNKAITVFDFTVVQGHRGEVEQNLAYNTGKSKLKWPDGKHNKTPSIAVDIAPYPIDWSDKPKSLARFYYLMGGIKAIAEELLAKGEITHRIRQGCDWNGNGNFADQDFDDLPHLELVAA